MDRAFKTLAFISLIFCSGVEIHRWALIQTVLLFITITFIIFKVTANAKMKMGSRRDNYAPNVEAAIQGIGTGQVEKSI